MLGDHYPETRDPTCIKRWPECESGAYDPRCCRFPKSCSCTIVGSVRKVGEIPTQPLERDKTHSLAVLRASIGEVSQFLSPVELRKYIIKVLRELEMSKEG